MSLPAKGARTPQDIVDLPLLSDLAYRAVATFFEVSGLWDTPAQLSGDLEEMGFLDKVYWFSKAARPIRRPERGSGLEAHFEAQRDHRWTLPDDFRVDARLSLASAGDLMNHAYLASSAQTIYSEIRDLLFGADVAMANLECMVGESPGPRMHYSGGEAPITYFSREAFDVVSGPSGRRFDFLATACNHTLDFGEEGVAATLGALRSRGIAFHGVNADESDASRATLIERSGIRLGVVAFTFGLNAHAPPAARPWLVNRMRLNDRPSRVDFARIDAQLAWCRAQQVDFVVAHLHWGMEFEFYPRVAQVELAHALAERGVDAIIGHHPHVVQPVELYRTQRDPDRVVPVFYSLGNLTNPVPAEFMTRSGLARLELAKGVDRAGRGRTYVASAGLVEVDQVIDDAQERLRLRPARAG